MDNGLGVDQHRGKGATIQALKRLGLISQLDQG